MKQRVIGTYESGMEQVQLVLREGTGAEFYLIPEQGKIARIKVGANQYRWHNIVNALMHEILELQMERLGCRLVHGSYVGNDAADFVFVANHPQFTEAVARSAEFMASALPDLAREWRKWRRKK